MDKICPTEDEEEYTLSQWLDLNGYFHWHTPMETFTKSWKVKNHAKKLGVRAGVSDHWVRIWDKANHRFSLLAIEMKRRHGGQVSDVQIDFINQLRIVHNVEAFVAYGADEAIKVITELEKGEYTALDVCLKRLERIQKNRQKPRKSRKKQENLPDLPNSDLPY